jgi:hypothetical protein
MSSKSLLELERGDCRFPVGETIEDDCNSAATLFCGEGREGLSSYCAAHHALAYRKVPPPKRAKIRGESIPKAPEPERWRFTRAGRKAPSVSLPVL